MKLLKRSNTLRTRYVREMKAFRRKIMLGDLGVGRMKKNEILSNYKVGK